MYTSIKVAVRLSSVTFVLFFLFPVNFRHLFYVQSEKKETERISKNLLGHDKKLTSVPGTILLVHETSCEVMSGIEDTSSILTVPIKLRLLDRPKS
jgi:hypothetical protein